MKIFNRETLREKLLEEKVRELEEIIVIAKYTICNVYVNIYAIN